MLEVSTAAQVIKLLYCSRFFIELISLPGARSMWFWVRRHPYSGGHRVISCTNLSLLFSRFAVIGGVLSLLLFSRFAIVIMSTLSPCGSLFAGILYGLLLHHRLRRGGIGSGWWDILCFSRPCRRSGGIHSLRTRSKCCTIRICSFSAE